MPLGQIAPVISEALSVASQIEKLSVLGVIAIWAMLATYAAWKLNRKLIVVYRQRDRARAERILYKAACDAAGTKVDTSDIDEQYRDDIAEEGAA